MGGRYNDNRIMDVLLSAVTINYLISDSGQVYYYIVHERKLFAAAASAGDQILVDELKFRTETRSGIGQAIVQPARYSAVSVA